MEEIIKSKEVIAYKGMKYDMTCKGFHYEIGKTYKTDKAKLCNFGFHACLNPRDILYYYPYYLSPRYYKVKLSGEIAKCDFDDTKVAATEITILEEIPYDKLLTNTEWWKHNNVLDLLYFSYGLARIKNCESKYNFIGKDGKILSKQWFEFADIFREGFAVVKNEYYVYNFINRQGKFLSEQWFENAFDFHEGLAIVQISDKQYNFINKGGKMLSEQWFNDAHSFKGGLAKVQRGDNLWNFIDKNGNYLSDEWFNYLDDFRDGFARVQRTNGECCKIDKTGKLYKDYAMEVEVYNRNFPTWIDGLPLVTTIERNKQYLHITREDCFGKPHSMQRDGNKTTYYIHGVEVSKKIWQEYIRIWEKNW